MKYSFVFGYRNRDKERVKRCFDSIAKQTTNDFEVVFTDYGSDKAFADDIAALCKQYSFVRLIRNETAGHPWNRGHALNSSVKKAQGEFIIFGDVDMIYSSGFLSSVEANIRPGKSLYGICHKLPEGFMAWDQLENYDVNRLENFGKAGKGGVHVVAKSKLEQVGAYDEFYCYWGVEDRDLNYRLNAIGMHDEWMEQQAPVFHQWHPETSDFNRSQFPLHWWETMNVYYGRMQKETIRNKNGWGHVFGLDERTALNSSYPVAQYPVHCTTAIFGEHGKTDTIVKIYGALNELHHGQRIRFEYVVPDDALHFGGRKIFSRIIADPAHVQKVQAQFNLYRNRINRFIPREDLVYIFWEIARNDVRFDYAFGTDGNKLHWTFALRGGAR